MLFVAKLWSPLQSTRLTQLRIKIGNTHSYQIAEALCSITITVCYTHRTHVHTNIFHGLNKVSRATSCRRCPNKFETKQSWISHFARAVQSHRPLRGRQAASPVARNCHTICLAGILNDPFCCMVLYFAIGDWMIPFAANAAATDAAKIANAFEWPGQRLKIALSPWEICTPM